MRKPTFIGPVIQRDPTSIASILRWVTANHLAHARAEDAKLFGPALDTAYDTARRLGASPDTIAAAMRRAG